MFDRASTIVRNEGKMEDIVELGVKQKERIEEGDMELEKGE